MGCDIHAVIERKKYSEKEIEKLNAVRSSWEAKKWVIVGELDIPRNYGLFALLSNVRTYGYEIPRISHELTLDEDGESPEIDLSHVTRGYIQDYGTDGHSHSYISLKELENADFSNPVFKEGFVQEIMSDIVNQMENLIADTSFTSEDIRMVFFFDN